MFQSLFTNALELYISTSELHNYIKKFDKKQSSIQIQTGEVYLRNVELSEEALSKLKLPFNVKKGTIGALKIRALKKLGRRLVSVQDVLLVVSLVAEKDEESVTSRVKQFKKEKLVAAEVAEDLMWSLREQDDLDFEDKPDGEGKPRVKHSILDAIEIDVSNVHVRLEDDCVVCAHSFSVGITLECFKLFSANEAFERDVTARQKSNNSFITRKVIEMKGLAVYCDMNWKASANQPEQGDGTPASYSPPDSAHMIKSLNGDVRMSTNHDMRHRRKGPKEIIEAQLGTLELALDRMQYETGRKLLHVVSNYETWLYSRVIRPQQDVFHSAKAWWRYAFRLLQPIIHERVQSRSWFVAREKCAIRKKYVPLWKKYVAIKRAKAAHMAKKKGASSQSIPVLSKSELKEMGDIEESCATAEILAFRQIALRELYSDEKGGSAWKSKGKSVMQWMRGPSAQQGTDHPHPAPSPSPSPYPRKEEGGTLGNKANADPSGVEGQQQASSAGPTKKGRSGPGRKIWKRLLRKFKAAKTIQQGPPKQGAIGAVHAAVDGAAQVAVDGFSGAKQVVSTTVQGVQDAVEEVVEVVTEAMRNQKTLQNYVSREITIVCDEGKVSLSETISDGETMNTGYSTDLAVFLFASLVIRHSKHLRNGMSLSSSLAFFEVQEDRSPRRPNLLTVLCARKDPIASSQSSPSASASFNSEARKRGLGFVDCMKPNLCSNDRNKVLLTSTSTSLRLFTPQSSPLPWEQQGDDEEDKERGREPWPTPPPPPPPQAPAAADEQQRPFLKVDYKRSISGRDVTLCAGFAPLDLVADREEFFQRIKAYFAVEGLFQPTAVLSDAIKRMRVRAASTAIDLYAALNRRGNYILSISLSGLHALLPQGIVLRVGEVRVCNQRKGTPANTTDNSGYETPLTNPMATPTSAAGQQGRSAMPITDEAKYDKFVLSIKELDAVTDPSFVEAFEESRPSQLIQRMSCSLDIYTCVIPDPPPSLPRTKIIGQGGVAVRLHIAVFTSLLRMMLAQGRSRERVRQRLKPKLFESRRVAPPVPLDNLRWGPNEAVPSPIQRLTAYLPSLSIAISASRRAHFGGEEVTAVEISLEEATLNLATDAHQATTTASAAEWNGRFDCAATDLYAVLEPVFPHLKKLIPESERLFPTLIVACKESHIVMCAPRKEAVRADQRIPPEGLGLVPSSPEEDELLTRHYYFYRKQRFNFSDMDLVVAQKTSEFIETTVHLADPFQYRSHLWQLVKTPEGGLQIPKMRIALEPLHIHTQLWVFKQIFSYRYLRAMLLKRSCDAKSWARFSLSAGSHVPTHTSATTLKYVVTAPAISISIVQQASKRRICPWADLLVHNFRYEQRSLESKASSATYTLSAAMKAYNAASHTMDDLLALWPITVQMIREMQANDKIVQRINLATPSKVNLLVSLHTLLAMRSSWRRAVSYLSLPLVSHVTDFQCSEAAFVVANGTDTKIQVSYGISGRGMDEAKTCFVQPASSVTLQCHGWDAVQVCIRPSVTPPAVPYAWSSSITVIPTKPMPPLYVASALSGNSPSSSRPVTKAIFFLSVEASTDLPPPSHVLVVKAPLVLFNALPVPFEFRLMTHAPNHTMDMMCEGSLAVQKEAHYYGLCPEQREPVLSIRLLTITPKVTAANWSDPLTLHDKSSSVELLDMWGRKLVINVDIEGWDASATRPWRIVLYCSFWIINSTDLGLRMHCSLWPEQPRDRVPALQLPAESHRLLMFSPPPQCTTNITNATSPPPKPSSANSNSSRSGPMVRLSSGDNGEMSAPIPLKTVSGKKGIITIMTSAMNNGRSSGQRRCELRMAVNAAPSPFHRSTIISFTPHIVLTAHSLPFPIAYEQAAVVDKEEGHGPDLEVNTKTQRKCLPIRSTRPSPPPSPHCSWMGVLTSNLQPAPLYWSKPSAPRTIRVRPMRKGWGRWSGELSFHTAGVYHVRLRPSLSDLHQCVLMRISIKQASSKLGGSLQVFFSEEDPLYAPFRLENNSSVPVGLFQEVNGKKPLLPSGMDVVEPSDSLAFAWDEPMAAKKRVVLVTDVQRNGNSNCKRIQIHSDGRWRTLGTVRSTRLYYSVHTQGQTQVIVIGEERMKIAEWIHWPGKASTPVYLPPDMAEKQFLSPLHPGVTNQPYSLHVNPLALMLSDPSAHQPARNLLQLFALNVAGVCVMVKSPEGDSLCSIHLDGVTFNWQAHLGVQDAKLEVGTVRVTLVQNSSTTPSSSPSILLSTANPDATSPALALSYSKCRPLFDMKRISLLRMDFMGVMDVSCNPTLVHNLHSAFKRWFSPPLYADHDESLDSTGATFISDVIIRHCAAPLISKEKPLFFRHIAISPISLRITFSCHRPSASATAAAADPVLNRSPTILERFPSNIYRAPALLPAFTAENLCQRRSLLLKRLRSYYQKEALSPSIIGSVVASLGVLGAPLPRLIEVADMFHRVTTPSIPQAAAQTFATSIALSESGSTRS